MDSSAVIARPGVRVSVEPRHLRSLMLWLLPLVLTMGMYWTTLSQPYFWDDVLHFQWATGRSVLDTVTNVIGLSYYRPLTFLLYKLFFELCPSGVTTPSHVLLLSIHVASGWLVGILTSQLFGHRRLVLSDGELLLGLRAQDAARLLASLLFVCYPFAVLPISHFAALVHPLVTVFTVGGVVAAVAYDRLRHRRWLSAAVVLAFLAPYCHESGVMAGWIAALVLFVYAWPQVRRNLAALILLPCASSSFLCVWLAIPRSQENVAWIGGQAILASATFFVQGPTYPLQPLSRLLTDALAAWSPAPSALVVGVPWWVLATVWGVAGIALGFATLALWRAGAGRVLTIALGWTILAALPSIVALPFAYITVSQRLLYCAGPAAALLWATVCVSVAVRREQPWARNAILLSLGLILAIPSVLYVQREMALHRLALRPLQELAAIARNSAAERHLVVNPVNWVNYKQPWYLLGHEGVSVSADYIPFSSLVQLNSGNNTRFRAVTFPAVKAETERFYYSTVGEDRPWDWATLAAKVSAFDRVWLTTYADERIAVEEVGRVRDGQAVVPEDYLASFEDSVFLVAAELWVDDEEAVVTLGWRTLTAPPNVTVFCHLYDCGGELLAQCDGHALGRMLPFSGLTPGTEVHDVRRVTLDAKRKTDCFELAVGLYGAGGTRVRAHAPDGQALQDNMALVPLTSNPK